MKNAVRVLFIVFGLVWLSSCSTPSEKTSFEPSSSDELRDSTVEIHYSLAQNFYRLEVSAKEGKIEGVNGVNSQSLEKRKIGRSQYLSFVNQASIVARTILREAKSDIPQDCKTPYALTVSRKGDAPLKVSGCRSHDPEGRIGRLIQEGEFLFYKPSVQ